MRPFSRRFYRTTVTHLPRVPVRRDGEEEDTWPGPGTALRANVSQGVPQDRFGQQSEETTTGWVLWLPYADVVAAGIAIDRGDQFTIAPAHGPAITLRVTAPAADFNQLHVSYFVQAQEIT